MIRFFLSSQPRVPETHDTMDVILPDGTEVTVARENNKTVREVTDDLLSKFQENLCQSKYRARYHSSKVSPPTSTFPKLFYKIEGRALILGYFGDIWGFRNIHLGRLFS